MGVGDAGQPADAALLAAANAVSRVDELAELLRGLRRRQARRDHASQWTLRELAARTGWARSVIGQYLNGRTLPPTDRFDVLLELFGATLAERGVLATARDRVEEARRSGSEAAGGAVDGDAAGQPGQLSTTTSRAGRSAVPRQLPARVRGFAGRAAELAALDGLAAAEGPYPAMMIAVVSGTAGVGKTALAVHWAHRVAERFPDGQLFVNLRGFEPTAPPMTPGEAVRGFLDGLGVAPERIPADLDAQVGLYRTVLAERRVLVLLDNAASVEQVRPLLPGSAGCLVVVTSRLTSLTVMDGAHPLPLGLLTFQEAGDLLVGRLGPDRLTAEPAAAQALIDACARLPLALSIVAARAANNPTFPLANLEADLAGSNGLDVLDGGEPTSDVRTVLSWSYERLKPPAARLFRLLGLHPGPDISAAAAASLAGTSSAEAQTLFAELTRASMLIEHVPGRYSLHDLLRVYAAELADAVDPRERDAARLRILDHYLHTAYTASLVIAPQRDLFTLEPAQPGVTVEPVTGHGSAVAWFGTERPVLLAVVRQATRDGFATHAWQLAWSMFFFLHLRGRWHDSLEAQQAALAAVNEAGDLAAAATVRRDLAQCLTRLKRFDEAGAQLRQARDIHAGLGDTDGEAWTLHRIGWMADEQGNHRDAVRHAEHALRLFRATGNLRGQAHVLNLLGWYQSQLGEHALALASCRQSLELNRTLGNDIAMANALDSIGYAHQHLGEYEQAANCYLQSLAFFRALGEPYYTAQALTHVGDVRHAMGDGPAARAAWQEALEILERLGHTNADGIRARLHDHAT